LNASTSFDPDGEIVRYRWTRSGGTIEVYNGPDATTEVVLGVGTHLLNLTVFDEQGAFGSDSVRVDVVTQTSGISHVIYRENFSRPNDGVERGPWEVGWNLMRYDGQPVASIKYDGNAHRSLSGHSYTAPWQSKINANPSGTEFDQTNARGHMWMNQMPFLNGTPAEWMLWTEEYQIDQSLYDVASIRFHATDESPERVKVSLAVRIEGVWYIFWDGRVETFGTSWREYTINFSRNGWYLFTPSHAFTIRNAHYTELPSGDIEAFGLYMFKDYGWYVNQIDNFTVLARERILPPPYLAWQLANFQPEHLYEDNLATSIWGDQADPDGDGNANLLEYALGGDPVSSGSLIDATLNDEGLLQLAFLRNPQATDVDLELQRSADLTEWQSVEAWWEMTGHEDGFESWIILVSPSQMADQEYFRLKATRLE
jgi:hypothetical protein